MKKLMIAAVIVCVAVVSQAASVTWKTTNVKLGDGTSAGSSTAYTFICSIYSAADDTFIGSNSDSAASFNQYTGSVSGTENNKAYYAILSASSSEYELADSIANTKFYFTTDGAASYTINFTDGSGMTSPTGGIGTWSASSWQAVPEPTSGLLLLLGVAGLALRRRRA